MKFDDNNIDTSQLDDRRGASGGGGLGGGLGGMLGGMGGGGGGLGGGAKMGGGLGIVVLLGILLLTQCGGGGGGLGGMMNGGMGDVLGQMQGQGQLGSQPVKGQVSTADLKQRCAEPDGLTKYDDCFVLKVMNETNEVWSKQLGSNYRGPKVVFFNGATRTACGAGQAQMGPFYCPGDERVYFDLNFLNQLQSQLGAQGRYAQAYIAAHEVGHHLQTVLGTEKQVRQAQAQNPSQKNALSVKMELQADCYGGVFGRLANDSGNLTISDEEFQEAIRAAAAVGDDAIQRGAGQRVNTDAFTHGSSEQREHWFRVGYESGDYKQCNTFAT